MSIYSVERRAEASPITDRKSLEEKIPTALHPHLANYLTDLALILDSPLIKSAREAFEKAYQECQRLSSVEPQLANAVPDRLAALERERLAAPQKPEPLPTTLKPTIGRLTRVILDVFLGIKLGRPDLAAIEKEIALLGPRQKKFEQEEALKRKKQEKEKRLGEEKEKLLSLLDPWAAGETHRALIHLVLHPERLDKLLENIKARVAKNPSPAEAVWYTAWILGTAKRLIEQKTWAQEQPKEFRNWFALQFPGIKKIEQMFALFAPSIKALNNQNWSLLSSPPVSDEVLRQVAERLKSNLSTPGFGLGVSDLTNFARWGLVQTAQNLGIVPSNKNPLPVPEVCRILSKKEAGIAPTPPERLPLPQKAMKERPLPTVCVHPRGSTGRLFIHPDGTFELVTKNGRKKGNIKDTLNFMTAISDVFGLKKGEVNRAKVFARLLPKFQRTVFRSPRGGDTERLKREVKNGLYAEWKTRFGDWVFIWEVEDNQVMVTFFGHHKEVYD